MQKNQQVVFFVLRSPCTIFAVPKFQHGNRFDTLYNEIHHKPHTDKARRHRNGGVLLVAHSGPKAHNTCEAIDQQGDDF